MHAIHETHDDYTKNLALCLSKWLRRRARRLLPEHLNAALVLLRINLDPIAPILKSLYSPSPRGRPAWNPLCMLRALLLMLLLQESSISKWASTLKHKPRLAIIAGFEPYKTPSAGAFYLFIDRLEDGPFQPNCPHRDRVKPSQLRKKKFPRNLKKEKEVRNSNFQIDDEKDQVTQQLKEKLLKEEDQPLPNDFLHRLEQLLFRCALIPSAKRGLLGNLNLNALELFGDSSPLVSNASPYGKPTCNCRQEGIYNCEHDRIYSDNTATWGWDSYREVYFFGHRFYQHQVSAHNHDLPVHITIASAHESDMTLCLKSLDRFLKLLKLNEPQSDSSDSSDASDSKGLNPNNWKVASTTYDAGHDALGIYEYMLAKEIDPVIALNPRGSGTSSNSSNSSKQLPLPKATGNASLVNEEGIPLCPAGLLMRRHSHDKKKHRIYYNCPVKRPTNRNSKVQWLAHIEKCPLGKLCQPETKMGPVVYVKTTADPRLYPTIPRDSLRFKELMNQRSGCERSNSTKKVTYRLEERPCRSATHYLFRLYLIALIEHAKAWLAEDKKRLGDGKDSDDPFLLAQAALGNQETQAT